MSALNLVSLLGVVAFAAIAWAAGGFRRPFPTRTVGGAGGLMLLLGAGIFWLPPARAALLAANDVVLAVLSAGQAGARFLFGPLALNAGEAGPAGEVSGFIIVGETDLFQYGDPAVWLIKTNEFGDTVWTKTFGETGYYNWGFSVQQTMDQGYIIVGLTGLAPLPPDVFLIKTDAYGNTLWTRTYGGSDQEDWGLSVQQTSDGGYIAAGQSNSFLKLNSDGTVAWQKTYGGAKSDFFSSVQQTSDGGYIVAGYTESFGVGLTDAWVLKFLKVKDIRLRLSAGKNAQY